MATKTGLTAKQTRAIGALLQARNVTQAAELAAVSYRSLNRWLADPVFKKALTQAESETLDAATRRLAGLGEEAVSCLSDLMRAESETVRLRVAQTVFDLLIRLKEVHDFEKRLTDLEAVSYGNVIA